MSTSKLIFNPLLTDGLQRISTTAETVITATKEPTGFDDPENLTVTYTLADRTITLSHASGFVKFWARGVEYSYASPWIVPTVLGGAIPLAHANVNGSYYLKIHADTLAVTYDTTPWDFRDYVMIAFTYKDATAQFSLRECHGTMPWQSHNEDHYGLGTLLRSAVVPTAGTYAVLTAATATNAANTPGLDAHTIYDEDIPTVIPAWPQGTYTVAYRNGVGGAWVWSTTDTSMFKIGASTFIQYNLNTAGTWSLADVPEDSYVNVLNLSLPVTADADSQKFRVVRIVGQRTFTTLAAAQAELPNQYDFGNLVGVIPEFVSNALWTFQKNSVVPAETPAGVAGRCFLAAEPVKFLGSQRSLIGQGGFSPTDHQSLSNRSATDSHPGTAVSLTGVTWAAGGILTTEANVFAALDKLQLFAANGVAGLVSTATQQFSGAKEFLALATMALGVAIGPGTAAAGRITYASNTMTFGAAGTATITDAGAATFAGLMTVSYANAAGQAGMIAKNTDATAGANAQIILRNDSNRNLRLIYSSSGGIGAGSGLTGGVTTECGIIATDGAYPLQLGAGYTLGINISTTGAISIGDTAGTYANRTHGFYGNISSQGAGTADLDRSMIIGVNYAASGYQGPLTARTTSLSGTYLKMIPRTVDTATVGAIGVNLKDGTSADAMSWTAQGAATFPVSVSALRYYNGTNGCILGPDCTTVGQATPSAIRHAIQATPSDAGTGCYYTLSLKDTWAGTTFIGQGPGLVFESQYVDGGNGNASMCCIRAGKTNATSNNYSFGLEFWTRTNGSPIAKVGTISDVGVWSIPASVKLGTAAGNYTPTALAHYQEGTWTPTIIASGTAGTPSYAAQNGYFTRVGNLVFLTCYINVSSWSGSPTGNMTIGGIPFAAATAAGSYTYSILEGASLTVPANQIAVAFVASAASVISLASIATGSNALSGLSVDTSFAIYFTITYRCA
jgi:hypothetical protein